jgi:glycosyltransferase involved in cell wall biosynthesis
VNSFNSFLLVPNHAIAIDGNTIVIESAEAEMARQFRTRFSSVGIAAFRVKTTNTSLAGKLDRSDVNVHVINCIEFGGIVRRVLNYLNATFVLPFVLRNYDVVYIFCPGHCGLIAAFWARLLRKPYGVYVRQTWLNKRAETPIWWSWIFSGAKFMVVTGESFKRRLLRYCNNVVNEVPLTALTPKQVDMANVKTGRSPSRMIFVGRINESKGVRDVIRAVALLKQQGLPVELLIAGGGTDEEVDILNNLRAELGINDSVTLLGHLSPSVLADEYKRSAIFVFPSYFAEGFPRVLYEAMMYGLAIVTCEMPGIEGFLIDGVNCVFAPPANPEGLAKSLRRVLLDQNFAAQIAFKARGDVESVYATFTDESHSHQVLRLLNEM